MKNVSHVIHFVNTFVFLWKAVGFWKALAEILWKKIQERLSRESNDPSEENDDEDEYLDDDLYDLQDEDDA